MFNPRPMLMFGLVMAVIAAGAQLRAQEGDSPRRTSDFPTGTSRQADRESRREPVAGERPNGPQETSLQDQSSVPPVQLAPAVSGRFASAEEPPATPETIARPQEAESLAADCQNTCTGSRWQDNMKSRLQYRYWGYAHYFDEPGLGANVYPTLNAQIGSGLAEQLVLYDYDFIDDGNGATLNAHGFRQLCRMARLMSHGDFTLVIERTEGNPGLNEARKQAVLRESRRLPVPLAEDRVVVSCPLASGLRGAEAEIIDANQLRLTTKGTQPKTYGSAAAFSGISGSGGGNGGSK